MSDTVISDEDKYANESFENDTDEIPEVSETESDSENEPAAVLSNSTLYDYARNSFNGRKNSLQNRNYVAYDSSSEDEDDVVISETIVEINTEPMCMDDAMLSPETAAKSALIVRRGSATKLRGRVRIPPCEPLAITEIPNTPKAQVRKIENFEDEVIDKEDEISDNDDDDDDDDEVTDNEDVVPDNDDALSDNGDGNSPTSKAIAKELIATFNSLTCATNESPRKRFTNAENEIVLESNALPSHLLREEEELTLREEPSGKLKEPNTPLLDEQYQTDVDDLYEADNVVQDQAVEINNELYEYEQEPNIDVHITSQTPTSFNSDDYAFHLNLLKQNGSNEKLKMRTPQQRKSWSFSNDRMREIERHNHILLRKILSQKPTYQLASPRPTKFATLPPTTRLTSAAVNRKKKQRQIDLDNQGLKRRIEAISLRRPAQKHLNS